MKKNKNGIFNKGAAVVISLVVIIVIGVVYFLKTRQEQNNPRISKLEVGTDIYALEEEVRNTLGQESVYITTNRSSGSGILWSCDGKELLVVTAGHLVTDFESGEIELWSGEKLEFTWEDVQVFWDYDEALIHLVSKETLKQEQGGAREYVCKIQPEIGDTMWVVDSVYGPASGINRCQVYAVSYYLDDYGMEMLLLSGEGIAGMSGCAVYDEEGRLVAMMSGMREDGSILAAVPVENLLGNIDL